MPTLAINTSANFVSLALLDQASVVGTKDSRSDYVPPDSQAIGLGAGAEDQLPPGYTQKRSKRGQATHRVFPPGASVMLAPLLKDLLDSNNLKVRDLDLIAIVVGPGLFTGLRVGVVTAKSLAYAGRLDLIAVNALEATAAQTLFRSVESSTAPQQDAPQQAAVQVVLNAQRQQLFSGCYESTAVPWRLRQVSENQILDQSDWLDQISDHQLVTGSGLKLIDSSRRSLAERLMESRPKVVLADESDWELSAVSVGKLAWEKYEQGHRDDLWKIDPLYFRPSAAEEQRDLKIEN